MSDELLAIFNSVSNHDEVRESSVIRAPFPYPGAKSRSIEHIKPHLPYRSAYCEPFGGSGAVWLSRNEVELEIFNDRFSGVTCFYRVLRDRVLMNALLDRLQFCVHSREEFTWSRDTWKDCEDPVERAARWYYTVMCSFAAQGRHFGRSLKGRPQQGPKLKSNLKFFPEVHNRIVNAQIENQDWRTLFKDYDQLDMVWYIDPPYYEYAKGMYECEMTKEEHRELLDRIQDLKGFVALSGYENPLYDSYDWDGRYDWMVRVSSLGQAFTESNHLAGHESAIQRGTAKEVLWIKEAAD